MIRRTRLVHRSTDRLSAQAKALMERGFSLRRKYSAIALDLMGIGEPVPERTIARRAAEWREERQRSAAARELAMLPREIWRVDELLALMQRIDVAPGWHKRLTGGLRAAISAFLQEPSAAGIREVESFLLLLVVGNSLTKTPHNYRDEAGDEAHD